MMATWEALAQAGRDLVLNRYGADEQLIRLLAEANTDLKTSYRSIIEDLWAEFVEWLVKDHMRSTRHWKTKQVAANQESAPLEDAAGLKKWLMTTRPTEKGRKPALLYHYEEARPNHSQVVREPGVCPGYQHRHTFSSRELRDKKERMDGALVDMAAEIVCGARSPERRRLLARLIWMKATHPLANLDQNWPYFRIVAWCSTRTHDDTDTQVRSMAEAPDNLHRTVKERFNGLPRMSDEWMLAICEEIEDEKIDHATAFVKLRTALGIKTDWADELARIARRSDSRITGALFPPGERDQALLAAFELRDRFSPRECVLVFNPGQSLLSQIRRAMREQPDAVVIIVDAQAFEDWEDALLELTASSLDAVVFAKHDSAFEKHAIPTVLLGKSWGEHRPAHVLHSLLVLQAKLRKPTIEELAQITRMSSKDVRAIVDRLQPAVVVEEGEGSPKVSLADLDLANSLLPDLPAGREGAGILENLLANAPLHIARGVMASLRNFGDRRTARKLRKLLIEFALAEQPHDTKIRSQWAERLAWMGEYQAAHDVILGTQRNGGVDGHRLELVNARIFAERYQQTGRVAFWNWGLAVVTKLHDELKQKSSDVTDPNSSQLLSVYAGAWHCWIDLARVEGKWEEVRTALASELADQPELRRTLEASIAELEQKPEATESKPVELNTASTEPRDIGLVPTMRVIEYLLSRGQLGQAESWLDKARKEWPDHPLLEAKRAKLLHEKKDYAGAVKAYEDVIENLQGDEALITENSLKDSILELHASDRAWTKRNRELLEREQPITNKRPIPASRISSYWQYTLSNEIKARAYGAIGALDTAFLELAEQSADDNPAVLSLLARTYAHLSEPDLANAARLLAKALDIVRKTGSRHDQVRVLNQCAELCDGLREPASQDSDIAFLATPEPFLDTSIGLEPDNEFTKQLRSRYSDQAKR